MGDIFVHDRWISETTRVSVASDGTEGDDGSYTPSISADGRFVAFESWASNLVSGDTNGTIDVFVHDRQMGETTRVSVASDGTEGDDGSYWPSISADGRFVAFESWASNLVSGDTNGMGDIFVHDRWISETTRVSVASDGTEGNGDSSYWLSISADGHLVAFESNATNLVSSDTNGWNDIFVHDRWISETTRVSVASDGTEGDDVSYWPSISADGRFVAFESWASNLVSGDTNEMRDIFVHNRQTGETARVSIASDGTEGNGGSYTPSISDDGRFVAFFSRATNLVVNDTNGSGDIFVASNPFLTGGSATKHYYANGQRVATRVDGSLYYMHQDHLGSTVAVSDASGQAVGRVQYDPYGEVLTSTLPVTLTDRLFTGQRLDSSTGLYYYNARYYDPHLGRFIQPDSLVPDLLNPQAWNRFSYCYNNPASYVDPGGHIPIDWLLDIGGLAFDIYQLHQDPSLANWGWLALDVGLWVLPFVPAAAGALAHTDEAADLARAAGRVEDAGARRVVVELGSGDFTNLPRIIADNPGARVIGIEHPDMQRLIEVALQNPEVIPEFEEAARGYKAALEAGAEIHFLNFGQGLPFTVDEIISIAPNPSSVWDVAKASSAVKPGGRIYIAAGVGESTGGNLVRVLSEIHGIEPTLRRGISRYPSKWLPLGIAEIIDFVVP
jgi:RHS repeat-associated protein